MRSALALCLLLSACATPQECVRDYSNPIQVYIPIAGVVMQRTVYPCRG